MKCKLKLLSPICFIFIIVVAILALYFLYNYLLIVFPLSNVSKHVNAKLPRDSLYIAVVACGQRLHESLVMIKSALLFNEAKELLHFIVFAEKTLIADFEEKLSDWKQLLPLQFDYNVLPLKFPAKQEAEWHNLFKPCAAQRLFIPSLLDSIDSLLYVDTDILFMSPVKDVWNFLNKFNAQQIAALTPEHEDENIGWYNRFARHPYYGRLGVNSGVMLMNLTRMRKFEWEAHVLPIYKEYKLRITWGDQDIINILFYYHPEKLYVMPCEYNYRPDHCMYMNICNTSVNGIKILHGNRGNFHANKQPLFSALYEAVQAYQLGTDPYMNFMLPVQDALNDKTVATTNCGKMAGNVLKVARKILREKTVVI